MKKILLIYPPFCTPASPPYSITYLASFLEDNSDAKVEVLDLNLEYHKKKYPQYQKYFQDKTKWENYEEMSKQFKIETSKDYYENNMHVVNNEEIEFEKEFLEKINTYDADIIAFSVVYSSQAFYTYQLIKNLQKKITVVGGPAVNKKLKTIATHAQNNEYELLSLIQKKEHDKLICKTTLDYTKYNLKEYFTPNPVIPLKTSSTCFYKGCTFCSHNKETNYYEYNLDEIVETIKKSEQKFFFIIDDMISTKRLMDIAKKFKPLNIKWACQLRPTKDLTKEILTELNNSGLDMIIWGVESGNDRVLKMMNKGTNIKDVTQVLQDSKNSKIKNVTYIMFGFPTETKEEFLETIEFLKNNTENIDLISFSIFGLQKDTDVYKNPAKYNIEKIIQEKRTILEPKIFYRITKGLTQEQATKLKSNHLKTILKLNKYPREMNYFREHMLILN